MNTNIDERMRVEALRQAVEARNLGYGPEDIVGQAEAFYHFLVGENDN